MNRLKKNESGIFLPCMISVLLKDLLFRSFGPALNGLTSCSLYIVALAISAVWAMSPRLRFIIVVLT